MQDERYEPIPDENDDGGLWQKIVVFVCFIYRKISY